MKSTHAVAELRNSTDTERLGTAFAVSRTQALTAYHCVRNHNEVLLRFIDQIVVAHVVHDGAGEDEANDLALLELADPLDDDLPHLALSAAARIESDVLAIGFPYAVAARRFTVGGRIRNSHAEHPNREHATQSDRYIQWLCEEALSRLHLRGLSGGPLIVDASTHPRAVGVVIYNETDDDGSAKGAAIWAASAETVAQIWPEPDGPHVQGRTHEIVVNPATSLSEKNHFVDVNQSALGGTTSVRDIFAPLSLRWISEKLLDVATRGGDIIEVRLDEIETRTVAPRGLGYASFLSVNSQGGLAMVRGTKLEVQSEPDVDPLVATIDSLAGGRCVEWRPDGQVVAAGGTNVLKIFGTSLEVINSFSLGGRYGVSTLDFIDNTLWIGLGNGELRTTEPPYKELSTVIRRSGTMAIAIRRSRNGKLAALWKDGLLQVWDAGKITATFTLPKNDTWAAYGPKLAWDATEKLYLCTGIDRYLYIIQHDSDKTVWRIQMDQKITSLDVSPDAKWLAVGLNEKRHQDGSVWITSLDDIEKTLPLSEIDMPSIPVVNPHHRLTADWASLLSAIRSRRDAHESDNVTLIIPTLQASLNKSEYSIKGADAEKGIIEDLLRRIERLRGRASKIKENVWWLASEMVESGFLDHEIANALDGFVSFEVSGILGSLNYYGYPPMGSLKEFVSSVLGEDKNNLLYLGFGTSNNGGVSAEVPISFLFTCGDLVTKSKELGEKYGADSDATAINFALQVFHDFDTLFNFEDKQRLWCEFVLPQTATRYPREQVVINPNDIRSVGLA